MQTLITVEKQTDVEKMHSQIFSTFPQHKHTHLRICTDNLQPPTGARECTDRPAARPIAVL